jgi:hypothetical protein
LHDLQKSFTGFRLNLFLKIILAKQLGNIVRLTCWKRVIAIEK